MAGTMSGKVINIRNNQPVEGVAITVQPGDHTTTSSQDGAYSLSLDAGTYNMTATASGFDPWDAEGIVVLDDVTTEINIALWPAE